MATEKIRVSDDCWSRWGAVIRKLAEKYNFPASNQDEINIFLRIFAGNGSTFRITSDPWRFIIDVTRRDNVIDDIIAIAVIAKMKEDPRRNGKVITRACSIHDHPDPRQPGAPALQWINVTSGGESYRHCCDKECRSSEKSIRARLTWETVRLKIIQKAYEQQVLALKRDLGFDQELLTVRGDLSQRVTTLNQLIEKNSEELAKSKESKKKWKKIAAERREELSSLRKDIEELQDQVNASEVTTTTALTQELDALKQKESLFEKEKEAFRKEKEEFCKEKRSFEMEKRNLESGPRTPRSGRNTLETRLRNLGKMNEELEKERMDNKKSIQVLQNINNGLRDRIKHLEDQKAQADSESLTQIKDMEDEVTELRRNVEALELKHKKHDETHQAEMQELNATNARIQNSRRSVDHYVYNLDVRVKRMEVQAKQDSDVITKLEAENQIRRDQATRAEEAHSRAQKDFQDMVSRHMNQVTELKHQIRAKDESLRRSQNDLANARARVLNLQRGNEMHHQMFPSYIPTSQNDLETQRKLQREADERIIDLRSKLDATELEVRAKTTEIAALGRRCADKTAALDYQEKKCFDYASKLATMRSEVDAARSRAEGAEKRCAEEVAGLKEDAEASKDRVHELEMECADKASAAEEMEKRCKDQETYAAGLEEQLELVRGSMEGALQQVSKRHGKKRRRTEGPDFDY